jgi:hypothetical protein
MAENRTRSRPTEAAALGLLFRQTRVGRGKSPAAVAEQLSVSTAYLYQLESGAQIANLPILTRLHAILHDGISDGRHQTLRDWLIAWLAAHIEKAAEDRGFNKDVYPDVIAALSLIQVHADQTTASPKSQQKILTNFPEAFYPLMVICGDRRELTPATQGDIFARSLSITDLMYIFELKLDPDRVRVRSDKLVANMEKEYLEATLGQHNLLVIGSPAVNLAARKINEGAVFRFPFDQRLRDFQETLQGLRQLRDIKYLRAFWRMALRNGLPLDEIDSGQPTLDSSRGSLYGEENVDPSQIRELEESIPKLMGTDTVKDATGKFKRMGFIDPADNRLNGFFIRLDNDFACISLARNPYDPTGEHVAILVAGLNGPGTAHALRMLNRKNFDEHPLGGIIEVELPRYSDWPSTLENARPFWQTRRYTAKQIVDNLRAALRVERDQLPDPYSTMTREEVEQCIDFVLSINDTSPEAEDATHETERPRSE